MKGILLAGGMAKRFRPATQVVSKQLLCVYDKPLIYYPLTTLLEMGIRDIAIIATEKTVDIYRKLLGDGSRFGAALTYLTQPEPGGVAQAFMIARRFIGEDHVCLLLGDNIFINTHLDLISSVAAATEGAYILAVRHRTPSQYGVVAFTRRGKIISLVEKPQKPQSHFIIPGLYFYDASVVQVAENLPVSPRDELEITDVNKQYWQKKRLHVARLSQGTHWFDAGCPEELFKAARYVRNRQKQTGKLIGCPEEAAYRKGWIGWRELEWSAGQNRHSLYGKYLIRLMEYA